MINTSVKLNKEQEEDLIRELVEQAQDGFKNDPLKELDEALMDRTTAQQSIQKATNSNKKKSKINTSNFDRDTKIQATQVIQKLKLTNIIESPKEKGDKTNKS